MIPAEVAILCSLAALVLAPACFSLLRKALHYMLRFIDAQKQAWGDHFLFLTRLNVLAVYLSCGIVAGLLFSLFTSPLISVPAAMMLGFLIPSIARSVYRKRRQTSAVLQLVDALRAIAASIRAGASFQTALETAVKEGLPPLSEEFGLVLKEMRMGYPLDSCLEHFMSRLPDEDIILFASAVRLNRETGGNLSKLLDELANTLQQKIEMRGRIDALTAQGRMQGWVMTALPVLVAGAVSVLEPEMMQVLFNTLAGTVVLTVGFLMLFAGFLTIRKIVNIDV